MPKRIPHAELKSDLLADPGFVAEYSRIKVEYSLEIIEDDLNSLKKTVKTSARGLTVLKSNILALIGRIDSLEQLISKIETTHKGGNK